ncbi:unnamed protein product [Bursaphelenchus xylophilus]|uniref:(pine wood nematode) hypothetical protein n=1 Tax=Bursaphelenchus xylophilus TaxID=6326 RepID=A0A1I7RYS8_BURXY|nr:unnamed protein product [Bursaphelenchus xylophilus]CAG9092291.1 unnamed protein product [Bursaphelenchus xylophilus]
MKENWTLPRRKAVWSDVQLSTCSICLDDWPIKPVACRRCKQCIGCGDCVDKWCNERLFSSPTCPLCRERWLSRREIVEMVVLPEIR